MWNYSTMVVLTVLTAGIFAAILIPFKGIPLIPGLTELRPANVIPVVFGLFFGLPGNAVSAQMMNKLANHGTRIRECARRRHGKQRAASRLRPMCSP